MLAVRDANQRLGLELPDDGSYTTIAGFLLARAGRLLNPGDKVEDTAGTFQIERVDKRRISRIRFVPAKGNEDQSVNFSALLTVCGAPSLVMKNLSTLEVWPLCVCL